MKASELCDKLSGKELPYQCYKKKSLMMATKEKLKPIMSDTLMINMQETDFLNV